MRRIVLLLALLVLTGTVVTGALAESPTPGKYTCSGGPIAAGTYRGLLVTGNCFFAGDVTVDGNLKVASGAVLNDHAFSDAVVKVRGNVLVNEGGILGLGAYTEPPPAPQTGTVVNGNIIANRPLSLYLSGITVHGNVVSSGGGGGVSGEFRNFPVKDDIIDGSLTVRGWEGGWLGVIRVQVGGNLTVSHNTSVLTDEGPGVDSDSTEVQTNVVGGDLICQGNTPPAQVNPLDGGQPNVVSGKALGECAGLTAP